MSKKEFLSWYSWLQSRILSAIDNVIATPFNNEQFVWAIEHNRTSPCSDPEDPYPNANHSSYAWLLRSIVACIAIFSVIFAIIILYYKKHRKKESASNYFFFDNLFQLLGKDKLENFLGRSSIPYDYLHAVTYFYNPDIYPIVLWYRRTWAFIRRDKDFYNLRNYLNAEQKRLKKTKQVLLEEIYQEINEKIILFINKKKNYGEWYTEKKEGKWFIRPSEAYIKVWQAQKSIWIEENLTNLERGDSRLSFINYLKELIISIKDKKIFVYPFLGSLRIG